MLPFVVSFEPSWARIEDSCSSLTLLDLTSFDTFKVTDMSDMFKDCASLDKITFGDRFVIS